ncbi:MAG TPA: hypothetical protein VFV38_14225 [Ktedonobacteraceae bacterium]|nr:hypothetical protein [Ktedonobacteraceae bacterium]
MSKQGREISSIASLSPDLAWKLLTPRQQKQHLEYLKKVHEWISSQKACEEDLSDRTVPGFR